MNERDSEAVGALLVRHGHIRVKLESEADLLIVNTCSVRGKAENKAIGKLGVLVDERKIFPGRIVGAVGCMVQRLKQDIFSAVPLLDFAVGTHSISHMPAILDMVLSGQRPILDVSEDDENLDELSGHVNGGISAFVNILLGCERRCTYCVVPLVRGKERSRPAETVLAEVRSIVEKGGKEVTLLGQSVMSYGRTNPVWDDDYVSPRGFSEPLSRLLEAVNSIEGVKRIRFTSGHPSGVTAELVRAMSELPAVCEHLHLPVQSGADRILKLMRRGYTSDEYRNAVQMLRSKKVDMALTTDFIVGFPSESADEFEMTRQLMAEIGFDNSFIFKYSPRPGTPAFELKDDVSAAEKMRRNKILLVLQDEMGLDINARTIGHAVEVLVEGVSLRNKQMWAGRTRTNKIVIFEPDSKTRLGDILNVKIDRVMAQTLYGKLI
ncbi:MAG: tRNA (N6-isopentenyl adenosine(37)-C2)-methylthiotransferase MiaB, partial [Lentisphaerae bacterium RIFOXYA12_FULL_48_11]